MLKKIDRTTSYKLICIIAIAVFIVFLIPILALGRYSVMLADDYSFSTCTHAALQNGKSLIGAAIEKAIDVYNTWQGSFAAVFLMCFQPGIFGYQFYMTTPVIMLLALCCGIIYFFKSFFAGIFNTNKYGALFVAVVVLIFATQFLPSAFQGLYWFNGAVYYTFFFGLELITAGLCISYVQDDKKWKAVLAGILAFILGGGNYVTALLGALMLLGSIILLFINKNKKYKAFAIVLVALLAALIISIVAPGNMVRQLRECPDHPGVFTAVYMSLVYGVQFTLRWLNLPTIAMLFILAPALWDMAQQSEKKFSMPGIVTLISYLMFSAMFCPHEYAMGSLGPGRIMNIIYFAFLLLVTINLFWWMGWLQRKMKPGKDIHLIIAETIAGILACVLIVIAIKLPSNPASLTSVVAIGEIRSGEAPAYFKENEERFSVLEKSRNQDVILKPLKNMPLLLIAEDMKDDPDNYMNQDASTYYHVKSIIVE